MAFFEKGAVRIHYEEAGSGFPLLLIAGGLIYYAFGFSVFTMFPIGFCLTGGLLAIAAGRPDEAKAHF